jgi:hypothetical protein
MIDELISYNDMNFVFAIDEEEKEDEEYRKFPFE